MKQAKTKPTYFAPELEAVRAEEAMSILQTSGSGEFTTSKFVDDSTDENLFI